MSPIKIFALIILQLSASTAFAGEDPRLKQGASGSPTGLNTSQQACACDLDEKALSQRLNDFRKNQVKQLMGEDFESGSKLNKPAAK